MKKLRGYGIVFELGWIVAFAVLIPLGIGLWLDRQLSTSPLFVFAGGLVGIIVATVGVVRIATRAVDRAAEQSDMDSPDTLGRED